MKNSQNSTRLRVARFWKFWKLIKININGKTNWNVKDQRHVEENRLAKFWSNLLPSLSIVGNFIFQIWKQMAEKKSWKPYSILVGMREWNTWNVCKEGSRDEKRCALRRTNGGQLVKFMLMQCRAYSNKYIQIFRRARFGMSVLAEPAYIPP